jgi:hypothetical protein
MLRQLCRHNGAQNLVGVSVLSLRHLRVANFEACVRGWDGGRVLSKRAAEICRAAARKIAVAQQILHPT